MFYFDIKYLFEFIKFIIEFMNSDLLFFMDLYVCFYYLKVNIVFLCIFIYVYDF